MPHRAWPVVALLFTASLINYLDRASLSLALPAISVDLQLDPARKGILLSSFFWSYAFMQIPIGLAVDRFPIRWFYAGMFALWSLACGLTGLVSSLAMFLGLRIVLGIGESIYYPGGTKTVSLLFEPSRRGLPSGIFNSGHPRRHCSRRHCAAVDDRVVRLAQYVLDSGLRIAVVAYSLACTGSFDLAPCRNTSPDEVPLAALQSQPAGHLSWLLLL